MESTGGTETEVDTSYTIQLNVFTISNYISVICLNCSYWHMKVNLIAKLRAIKGLPCILETSHRINTWIMKFFSERRIATTAFTK